jgi:hypothetical protein
MKIGLVICGMILGVLLTLLMRPAPVQAQSGTITIDHVYAGTANVGSRTVVGFACVAGESKSGSADCYVASR